MVPVVRAADDVVVVVAGGDGRHSAWLAGLGRNPGGNARDRVAPLMPAPETTPLPP